MVTNVEEKLRNSQLAFVSKIISGATHEFKNHLAIINESAGLIGDLLSMEEGSNSNAERYMKVLKSIGDRVEKASRMTTDLNQFGHRMDFPKAQFLANDLLSEELHLVDRFAGQKKIVITPVFDDSLSGIYNYPGLCQYTVFKVLEHCINVYDQGSTIEVKTLSESPFVRIQFKAQGGVSAEGESSFQEDLELLEFALSKMSSELTQETLDSGEVITLSLRSLNPTESD